MTFSYFWIFVFLLAAGMPVVFALLIAPGLSLFLDGEVVFYKALLSRLYNGMDSFPLMALPFFILVKKFSLFRFTALINSSSLLFRFL